MLDFVNLISAFYQRIFNVLHSASIRFGTGANDVTSVGAILFACIVIGFVTHIYWKGAKA